MDEIDCKHWPVFWDMTDDGYDWGFIDPRAEIIASNEWAHSYPKMTSDGQELDMFFNYRSQ